MLRCKCTAFWWPARAQRHPLTPSLDHRSADVLGDRCGAGPRLFLLIGETGWRYQLLVADVEALEHPRPPQLGIARQLSSCLVSGREQVLPLYTYPPPYRSPRRRRFGPAPIADRRHVVAMLADVFLWSINWSRNACLTYAARVPNSAKVDHVLREVEAVQVVQHHHVNGVVVVLPPCSRARAVLWLCGGRSGWISHG